MFTRFVFAALYSAFLLGITSFSASSVSKATSYNIEQLSAQTRKQLADGEITLLPIVEVSAKKLPRKENVALASTSSHPKVLTLLAEDIANRAHLRDELVGAAIRVPFYAFSKSLNTQSE
jgi:hypothetical protein